MSTKEQNQQDRGMAVDIAEGTFAVIAVYRHQGKVEAAHLAGRLDDLDRQFVESATFSLLDSLRKKAAVAGATQPQPLN